MAPAVAEPWAYYLLGSAVEVAMLLAIAVTAGDVCTAWSLSSAVGQVSWITGASSSRWSSTPPAG